jgi:hypothetical protein
LEDLLLFFCATRTLKVSTPAPHKNAQAGLESPGARSGGGGTFDVDLLSGLSLLLFFSVTSEPDLSLSSVYALPVSVAFV